MLYDKLVEVQSMLQDDAAEQQQAWTMEESLEVRCTAASLACADILAQTTIKEYVAAVLLSANIVAYLVNANVVLVSTLYHLRRSV